MLMIEQLAHLMLLAAIFLAPVPQPFLLLDKKNNENIDYVASKDKEN
jgi:hypothetical protein